MQLQYLSFLCFSCFFSDFFKANKTNLIFLQCLPNYSQKIQFVKAPTCAVNRKYNAALQTNKISDYCQYRLPVPKNTYTKARLQFQKLLKDKHILCHNARILCRNIEAKSHDIYQEVIGWTCMAELAGTLVTKFFSDVKFNIFG